jgi:hypothetical protein
MALKSALGERLLSDWRCDYLFIHGTLFQKLLYGKNDLINEHCDEITGCLYYLDVGHQA